MAGVLAEWMTGEGADVALADVAHTLNHHRTRHKNFATVCARDRAQAMAGLRRWRQVSPRSVWWRPPGAGRAGTVFVFSGQGSQWAGMGRRLLADEPAFAAAVDELEPVFVEQVGFSLRQVIVDGESSVRGCAGAAGDHGVAVGVDGVVALLWGGSRCGDWAFDGGGDRGGGGRGAEPGRGVAGDRDPVAVDVALAGQGAVALLELDAEATEELIADYPEVSLAGYLSPRQTVVAGSVAQVDAVIAAVSAGSASPGG